MALKILKRGEHPIYMGAFLPCDCIGYYVYIYNQMWNKNENVIEVRWKKILSIEEDTIDGHEYNHMRLNDEDIESLRKVYVHPVDVNGSNFVEQAYCYLKGLTEFSDAEDC